MQLQLECCNLDNVILYIKAQFYDNNIDYYNDTSPNDSYIHQIIRKGILIKYEDQNNKILMYTPLVSIKIFIFQKIGLKILLTIIIQIY